MKKVLSLLFLLHIACFTAFSQTHNDSIVMLRDKMAQRTEKFLTVKGIELKPGLKTTDLLRELLNKGFQKDDLYEVAKEKFGVYLLEGPFFNRHNCGVKIVPNTSNKNIVSIIGIEFPEANSFKQLKSDYDVLKASLSEKYHINRCHEQFDEDYVNTSTSDFLKLSAIENDAGNFETRFYVSEDPVSFLLGEVVLSICHVENGYGRTKFYVLLSYTTSDEVVEQMKSYNDDL